MVFEMLSMLWEYFQQAQSWWCAFFSLNASINSSSVFFFHRVDHIESSSQCPQWWQQSFNWSKPRFFRVKHPVITQHSLTEVGKFGPGMLALRRPSKKSWRIEQIEKIFNYSDRSLMRSVGSYIELALVFQSLRWGHVVKVFDFTFGPPSWSLANALKVTI